MGAPLDTAPASNGATTSSLPVNAFFQGDEDVATPFLWCYGGSVERRPSPGVGLDSVEPLARLETGDVELAARLVMTLAPLPHRPRSSSRVTEFGASVPDHAKAPPWSGPTAVTSSSEASRLFQTLAWVASRVR